MPVLVDTDIGSNVDDALALAYLLRQPRCDLIGVTTVTGDVRRRAAVAEVVCRAAGRADVPIHCGAADPLLFGPGQRDVPHYAAVRHRPHQADRPPSTAVDCLRRTIRDRPGEVVLLTIGPLTNVALLFALDPEIPSLLRRVVSMAGVYFPPAPEVPSGKAETNIGLDPVAAAIVFTATAAFPPGPDGPRHVCFGLDVTMQCRMPAAEFRRRSVAPPLDVVLETAEAWFAAGGGRRGWDCAVFHDPLAAAAIFRPEVCRYADGRVTVDATPGGPSAGLTTLAPAGDGGLMPHRVAAAVDEGAFFDEYFSVFS